MKGAVAAIVLAAGTGTRMGAAMNKVLLPLGGETILARSLEVFLGHPAVDRVLLVGDRSELDAPVPIVPGGTSRHTSERNGLLSLADAVDGGEVGMVLVHDAARPFVTKGEIDRLLAAARDSGAAILAARVDEFTLAFHDDDGRWRRPSGPLWAAQTPQGFDARLALRAHRQAATDGFEGTDTASVVERLGHPVTLVEGSAANIKITTPGDLVIAESILDAWRTDPDRAARHIPHI